MKLGVLLILVATLALAACATQPSAKVLDAQAQRSTRVCIANAWMHIDVPREPREVDGRRRPREQPATPIPGAPQMSRIERKCQ